MTHLLLPGYWVEDLDLLVQSVPVPWVTVRLFVRLAFGIRVGLRRVLYGTIEGSFSLRQ
jgi:hypothetical protein